MNSRYVINAKGEKESFSRKKVYRSAKKAGASNSIAKEITESIERSSYPGIKTSEIFKKVRDELIKKELRSGLRFSLKEAMRKLGPTGFQFEKYIAEIFSEGGFKVKTNQNVSGFCGLSYEIDFTAEKEDVLFFGECKYRNSAGGKVHLDEALSNYARFLDISKKNSVKKVENILVTNTKFTSNVIRYSKCVGMKLLGWGYPKKEGLEYLIESQKLYPITILPSLKSNTASILVQRKKMLAKDILNLDVKRFSRKAHISSNKLKALVKEARILLG